MNQRRLALSIALGAAVALGLLLGLAMESTPAQAPPSRAGADSSEAIDAALAYLETRQLPNGGVESDFTPGTSDDFATIKTVFALAAAGRPVSYMTSVGGNSPLDYLEAEVYSYTRDITGTVFPGRVGMVIAAAVAGNGDPYAFGQYPVDHPASGAPINLVEELQATYHPATGAYSTTARGAFTSGDANTANQMWALVGLASAQEMVPGAASDFFIDLQESDGGWAWVTGLGGDVDMTGLAIQALLASGNVGPTDPQIQEGLGFLRDRQLDSGGWAGYYGGPSADSTAAAIQAIAAAGYMPATVSWATESGLTPHDELIALQSTNGSFGDNALATAHAIAGLAEAPVPTFGRVQRANLALTWMDEEQNADGSWSGLTGPDPGATCDAVLAYAAAGYDPDSVTASGSSLSAMDYVSAAASSFVTKSADSAGKLALAVEAAGGDAHSFGGVDVVAVLSDTWYSPTLGAFGVPTNTWHQAWAILGLEAAGETVPPSAVQTLIDLQNPDGGWKYDLTEAWWNTTTPDNTGLAIQALMAADVPVTDSSVISAVNFLRDRQDAQGGWGNANGTAYAVQGLLAAGEDLTTDWTTEEGRSPYNALIAYQKGDGPFVDRWDSPWGLPADNGLATRQAVPALLGSYYPLATTLRPFLGVYRGPDPDRTVAAAPRASWGNSAEVVVPFGSDLDADGDVTLTWREVGSTSWQTETVNRADGYYTATVDLPVPGSFEIRAIFADPDRVQYGTTLTEAVSLSTELARYRIFLPFVLRR